MRYQERIYIQNSNSAVKNKDIFNVSMSSDVCVFNPPYYDMNGGSKINCTGGTSIHVVNLTATTIPLTFLCSEKKDALFNFEIYKYDNGIFQTSPIYQSELIPLSAFNSMLLFVIGYSYYYTKQVPINDLKLDGEYLIKIYHQFSNCNVFLKKLNKIVNTLNYKNGKEYNLYDKELDFYFTAIIEADKPKFSNIDSTPPNASLTQQVILPEAGINIIPITNDFSGDIVVTFNGIILAENLDYTLDLSSNTITLSASTEVDDIITLIYTKTVLNNITVDVINVLSIPSGDNNDEGSSKIYYNTDTSKYEVFTTNTPVDNSKIIVMLNGVTLADGIDYYQSVSNKNKIILEGNIVVSDIITIVYFPMASVINGVNTNSPIISWYIKAPQTNNGVFTLEVSTGNTFSNFYYTGNTNYIAGQSNYTHNFNLNGNIGTKLYYRVKNTKKYTTLCDNTLEDTIYSEVVQITIQTNAINSY